MTKEWMRPVSEALSGELTEATWFADVGKWRVRYNDHHVCLVVTPPELQAGAHPIDADIARQIEKRGRTLDGGWKSDELE